MNQLCNSLLPHLARQEQQGQLAERGARRLPAGLLVDGADGHRVGQRPIEHAHAVGAHLGAQVHAHVDLEDRIFLDRG